jgi:hypothetical protein
MLNAMITNIPMRSFIVIATITLLISGCGRTEKFTRQGWDDGDGLEFPRRIGMVDDLLKTHKLKGLTYKQVTALLHEPQRNSYKDRSFHYEIIRKMDGIDTVYTKNLVFYLSKDSIVTDVKVTEKEYPPKKKRKKQSHTFVLLHIIISC